MGDNSDDDIGGTGLKKLSPSAVSSDNLTVEVRQKIHDAFRVFDHENNSTVDVREIGTIIRSLGFCPSEAELQDVLRDMEDPQQMGYIQYDRFYPGSHQNQITYESRNIVICDHATFSNSFGFDEILFLVMSKIISQQRFQLTDSEELLIAFKTLDISGKGVLSVEDIRRYFTQFGEPFAQDEIDELLNACVTPNTRDVHYKTFVHHLIPDEGQKIL